MSQKYQDYWKLTVEYSDIHGEKFINTLSIIVDFIDQYKDEEYSQELYDLLQQQVNDKYPKANMASVRKSINQFVKLGFVNFEFRSYHNLTLKFLESKTNRRRREIFSNIFYSNSKLNATITNDSSLRQSNFLLRTLEEVGKLSKDEIMGLMTVDIKDFNRGYLLKNELELAVEGAREIGFDKNKYNQISYLLNFLKKLNGIVFIKDQLYFEDDAKNIFGDELSIGNPNKRDPYLHRNYKIALKEEAKEIFNKEVCMVEKLEYPVLIASHIKPFVDSSEGEKYDPNNGLLLSRTLDSLFDLNYISFDDDGKIIFSEVLSKDIKERWEEYSLVDSLLSEQRLKYLKYHREKLRRL